ncbi:hypothetical protein ACH5RR_000559 [Cinchona calisaya]|uniref:Uncharacterized protein n=1 Tax=Cinchona calisaya TaxID=153742 RepID=A0ABD3B1J0_9GENT
MQKLQKDSGKSRVNASLDEAPYVPQGTYPNTHICGMQNAVKNSVPVKYPPEASSFAFSAESRRASKIQTQHQYSHLLRQYQETLVLKASGGASDLRAVEEIR